MSKGFVYILSNPSMPGLLKIGKTCREVDQRTNELYNSGVPTPFKVEREFLSPHCGKLEHYVHTALHKSRDSNSREFFRVGVHIAAEQIETCLRDQLSGWLQEFLPDHSIVNDDAIVDVGAIHEKIYTEDIYWPDIRIILEELTAEELRPSVQRVKRKQNDRLADMGKSGLRVIGSDR